MVVSHKLYDNEQAIARFQQEHAQIQDAIADINWVRAKNNNPVPFNDPYEFKIEGFEQPVDFWVISFEERLGADLQQWHSSGGDSIYSLGSYVYGGHAVCATMLADVAPLISTELSHTLSRPDSDSKADNVKQLSQILEALHDALNAYTAMASDFFSQLPR